MGDILSTIATLSTQASELLAALTACQADRAALLDRLTAEEGKTARYKAHAGTLGLEVIELRAQIASLGGPPATPVAQVVMGRGVTIQQGLTLLGERLGRALEPGEVARLVIPSQVYDPLALDTAAHAFWAKGTLEVAAKPGGAILTSGQGDVALRLDSTAPTGGTCVLALRDITVKGHIVLSVNGGMALRTLGLAALQNPSKP